VKRSIFLGGTFAATMLPLAARAQVGATLATPTGDLEGTLELPGSEKAVPLVLVIAGSGPTDRDGNSALLPGSNDSLKLLALALAERGVASLRYDKRGVGRSSAAGISEESLRFETFVDDAAAWVRELKTRSQFSRILIAGHSEGSLVGMLAAQREPVAGFVSLEGAGHPASTVVRTQLQSAPPELRARAGAILDRLVAAHTVDDVPPALGTLFRPSIQPYLISWFRYDPAKEIAKLRIPVAIVQGGADVQTRPSEGEALHAAAPAARYVFVPGMNHVLKDAPDTSTREAILAGYSNPALPVDGAVVGAVASLALGT
jgi:pimeloyl-ACP methyl ester carboxylesterase